MMTKAAITPQVPKIVSGHALPRLDCSFDDSFVVLFLHQGLSLLRKTRDRTRTFPGINAIAARPFLGVRPRNFQ